MRLTGSGNPFPGVEGEIPALEVLSAYGIAVPAMAPASNEEQAARAASRIGYPVALKTTRVAHKSEADGVILGIGDEMTLRTGYSDLAARLGNDVVVAEMIEPGIELAMGMITDPQFGPVVLFGAGGTFIEVMGNRVAILPPIDIARAEMAIARSGVKPILDGHRIDAVAEALARFSELAIDCDGVVASIDVNPLILTRDEPVAVDALFTVL